MAEEFPPFHSNRPTSPSGRVDWKDVEAVDEFIEAGGFASGLGIGQLAGEIRSIADAVICCRRPKER